MGLVSIQQPCLLLYPRLRLFQLISPLILAMGSYSDVKHLSTYIIKNAGTQTVIDLDAIERKKGVLTDPWHFAYLTVARSVAGWGLSGRVNQWVSKTTKKMEMDHEFSYCQQWTAYQHEGNSWSFHNDIAPGDKTERRYLQHDGSTVSSSAIDSSHPYIPVWDVYPAPGAGRPYFQYVRFNSQKSPNPNRLFFSQNFCSWERLGSDRRVERPKPSSDHWHRPSWWDPFPIVDVHRRYFWLFCIYVRFCTTGTY